MHGEGTFTDNVGHRYSGNWSNNKRSGKGTYIFAGNKKDVLDNPVHLYFNGSRYVGEWKENKFHGKGSFKYLNGDTYDGEWKMDKREGKGLFVSKDGEHYDGEWARDEKMVLVKWILLMAIDMLEIGKMELLKVKEK